MEQWETGVTFEPKTNFWWYAHFEVEGGGAIFLRKGTSTAKIEFGPENALSKSVRSDLVDSIQLAHSAGVLQCDLRRNNFVKFGDSWQVIDYSLSAQLNSGETNTKHIYVLGHKRSAPEIESRNYGNGEGFPGIPKHAQFQFNGRLKMITKCLLLTFSKSANHNSAGCETANG